MSALPPKADIRIGSEPGRAVAVGYLTGDTFAQQLDCAIKRSEKARFPRLIEARADPTD
jgi:hypothetical protein